MLVSHLDFFFDPTFGTPCRTHIFQFCSVNQKNEKNTQVFTSFLTTYIFEPETLSNGSVLNRRKSLY